MPEDEELVYGDEIIEEEEQGSEPGEQEQPASIPIPEPVATTSKLRWIGDSKSPDATKHRDGISDLFAVDSGAEMEDADEAMNVDVDNDVIDSDEDGSMDSLTEVSEEDIMGWEDPLGEDEPEPEQPRYRPVAKHRPIRVVRRPLPPPTGMTGVRGTGI